MVLQSGARGEGGLKISFRSEATGTTEVIEGWSRDARGFH
jgi:hypothetical protein